MKLNIVLCDDEDLFREGLRLLISKHPEYKVVGEADNGKQLISLISAMAEEGKTPDLILLDVEMPVLRGPEAAKKVREIVPEVKILGLTGHTESGNIIAAFKNGFDGYVYKDTVFEEVKDAITKVIQGSNYLSPTLADKVVFNHIIKVQDPNNPFSMLTERELAILKLILEEKTPKEIAYILSISRKTVDIHKKNIMKRLGIRTFAGLIKYCVNNLPT